MKTNSVIYRYRRYEPKRTHKKRKDEQMETYKQSIIKFKGNKTVINNMLFAAGIHDRQYKTNFYEELENWLISEGYEL
jgi:hypothetical protein